MKFFLSALCLLAFSSFSHAQDEYKTAVQTGQGTLDIHHSVFSSTSLTPKIAERYQLVRGKDYVLVNIAVVPQSTPGQGIPAKVTGKATNLMQQMKSLDFKEIEEPGTVYYIAELRVTEEEHFHFDIDVALPGESSINIKFTKKMYVNE
ncbi:DUF4426 domain-containing protein [Aurantivibrio plasticivorans]